MGFLSNKNDDDLRRLVTSASLGMAIFLVCLKLGGALVTDSLSLLSSLIDSASDIVASLGTFVGVRAALLPADNNHRYGHGKAEAMAALGTAAFILGSATFLMIQVIMRLLEPSPIDHAGVGIIVMVASMICTLLLVLFQRYVVARTGSIAVSADQAHYTADFVANGATIFAIIVTYFTHLYLVDALFGAAVAVWLVVKAIPVAREANNILMDHEAPEKIRQQIVALTMAHTAVRGVHDLRTRHSGNVFFIELHVELDGDLPLRYAHAIGEQIEEGLRHNFEGSDVVIHFDPAGIKEWRRDDQLAN